MKNIYLSTQMCSTHSLIYDSFSQDKIFVDRLKKLTKFVTEDERIENPGGLKKIKNTKTKNGTKKFSGKTFESVHKKCVARC